MFLVLLPGRSDLGVSDVGKDGDTRQPGPNIIVEIGRNARSKPLDGQKTCQPRAHDRHGNKNEGKGEPSDEPPVSPERWKNSKLNDGRNLACNTTCVDGPDHECVRSGHQRSEDKISVAAG